METDDVHEGLVRKRIRSSWRQQRAISLGVQQPHLPFSPTFHPMFLFLLPVGALAHSPAKKSPTSLTTWSLCSTCVKWLASCNVTHLTFGVFPKNGSTQKSWASSMLPLYTSVEASMLPSRSSTVLVLSEPVSASSEDPYL
jgi:hypothetical protein